jgi:hypothetical protein
VGEEAGVSEWGASSNELVFCGNQTARSLESLLDESSLDRSDLIQVGREGGLVVAIGLQSSEIGTTFG